MLYAARDCARILRAEGKHWWHPMPSGRLLVLYMVWFGASGRWFTMQETGSVANPCSAGAVQAAYEVFKNA